MGLSRYDVDRAVRIIPQNAVANVAELNSNFTVYLAELNPETAGESIEPFEAGSTAEVAYKFKPSLEFEVKKVDGIGTDDVSEVKVSSKMQYGADPKEIMNDFTADNLVVKMKSGTERVLLDQQLEYLALEDLMEKLKDAKFAKLFQSNKDNIIASIEAEIARVQKINEQIEFEKSFNED